MTVRSRRNSAVSQANRVFGVVESQATVNNNTGALTSTGLRVTLSSDTALEFTLFVTSAAAVAGGLKLQLVVPSGFARLQVLGNAASAAAQSTQNLAENSLSQAFCTFDCSAALGGGSITVRAMVVASVPQTIDLQFVNVTGGQSYGVLVGSFVVAHQV